MAQAQEAHIKNKTRRSSRHSELQPHIGKVKVAISIKQRGLRARRKYHSVLISSSGFEEHPVAAKDRDAEISRWIDI